MNASTASMMERANHGGLRLTASRRRVVEFLEVLDEPLTSLEILRRIGIEWPACERALIYRTLRQLLAAGVVICVGVKDRSKLYIKAQAEPVVRFVNASNGSPASIDAGNLVDEITKVVTARGYRLGGRIEIQVLPGTEPPNCRPPARRDG